MRQHTKIALTVLSLWLSTSASSYAAEVDGVVRLLDTKKQLIGLGDNPYPYNKSIKVRNLGNGPENAQALKINQRVRLITNQDGALTEIWIFPETAAKRKQAGYRLDETNQ